MGLRGKIDGMLFSDIIETIFLWYLVIMLITGVVIFIAISSGYIIDEPISKIIAMGVLPICLYLLYTIMVPTIGDYEE